MCLWADLPVRSLSPWNDHVSEEKAGLSSVLSVPSSSLGLSEQEETLPRHSFSEQICVLPLGQQTISLFVEDFRAEEAKGKVEESCTGDRNSLIGLG